MHPPTARRLLCLWLPNWPIQRWRASNAADALDQSPTAASSQRPAAGAPVVLWGTDPRRGRLVVACCERAQTLGVRPGMTVSQADTLARGGTSPAREESDGGEPSAPSAAHASSSSASSDPASSDPASSDPWVVPHDSGADEEALRELAERCALRLSPLVALEPLDEHLWAGRVLHQPQALLMDVTGIGPLFGGEPQLAQAAHALLQASGYRGRVAIADTAGAAWGVAHCAPLKDTPDAAHDSLDEATWIVPPGAQQQALEPLRVASLRVPADACLLLRRLGVETVGDLLRLPRAGLATRLGSELLRRLDEALGTRDESLPIHHAAPSSRRILDLEYPTSDLGILEHRLRGMLSEIAGELTRRQRGALRLTCSLELETPPPLEVRLGLFTPSASADHWLGLLMGNLQRCRLPTPVHRILVAATLTGPLRTRQPFLADMGDGQPASLADLARLIDTLSGRLGRGRVLGAAVTEDPLPEQAVRTTPLAGQPPGTLVPGRPAAQAAGRRASTSRRGSASDRHRQATLNRDSRDGEERTPWTMATPRDPLRRPILMLGTPQRLVPLPSENGAEEELPRAFRRGGQTHRITRFWGPERIESGWWNGPLQRRDYYRVESEDGQWIWIYHDLRQHQWWLHGYF